MCLAAWPSNESEADAKLVWIEIYVNDAVLVLISTNLNKTSSDVSIKTRSTAASFSFKGQETKHTTAKWSIGMI